MIFTRHLDSRGDGSGVKNANGKYADSVVTFTNATNVVNLATHGYVTGDGPFTFTTTGGLPTGLALLTDYYVGPTVAAGTFDLSLTRGGATVPFSTDGTATTTVVTPFVFSLEPAAGETFFVTRLLVSVRDLIINADDYGNISSGLTNGITFKVYEGTIETADLTDGVAIKTNGDWRRVCYDASTAAWGSGDQFLNARWTFEKHGEPIRLDGSQGERIEVVCHDDLDGLVNQYFVAQGYTG